MTEQKKACSDVQLLCFLIFILYNLRKNLKLFKPFYFALVAERRQTLKKIREAKTPKLT
jgi:hypothetical protein